MTLAGLPTDVATALERAAIAYRTGSLDEALANAGRAVQLDANHVPALTALAAVQHALGENAAALPPLARALRLAPADGHARQLRALILRALGQDDEALAELRLAAAAGLYRRRAACAAPDYAASLEALGAATAEAGRADDAAALFGAALAIGADREAAALGLAALHGAGGRPDQAEAVLRKACDLAPGRPTLHLALGDVLAAADRRAEAADAFRVAEAANPEATDTTRRLARVADGREAEMAWRRVLARHPDDAEACGQLATLLADTQRPAEALPLARRWVVASKADPAATALLRRLTEPPSTR